MNQNEKIFKAAARYIPEIFKKSPLHQTNKILSISMVEFILKGEQEGFILVNSNYQYTNHIKEINNIYSINGSFTIKATNGVTVQWSNPNRKIHGKYQDKNTNNFIITTPVESGYIEIIIETKIKITTPEQTRQAHLLFAIIKGYYYRNCKNAKLYDLQNTDTYKMKHEKDLKDKKNKFTLLSANSKISFNNIYHLDKDLKLSPIQLKIIIGMLLAYNSKEFKEELNISADNKCYNLRQIKEKFNLPKEATEAELLRKLRSKGVVQELENNFKIYG